MRDGNRLSAVNVAFNGRRLGTRRGNDATAMSYETHRMREEVSGWSCASHDCYVEGPLVLLGQVFHSRLQNVRVR
jgi:hypothetical protein